MKHPITSSSLTLARWLLARESLPSKSSVGQQAERGSTVGDAAQRYNEALVAVLDKARITLTAFAGKTGFQSLLKRALTLAQASDTSLLPVRVLDDGSVSGLMALGNKATVAETAHVISGHLALVAQLLELLVIFIGEPLMHQMVRSAWPDVPASAFRSRAKDSE